MSMMEKAFMVVALAELVFMLALLRVVRKEADGARELLNVLHRQYDEMRALAVMNAWALDRAHNRLVMARNSYAHGIPMSGFLDVAVAEIDTVNDTDPAVWMATKFADVVAPAMPSRGH